MKYSGQYKVKNHTKLLEPEAKKLRIFTSILLYKQSRKLAKIVFLNLLNILQKKHDLKKKSGVINCVMPH